MQRTVEFSVCVCLCTVCVCGKRTRISEQMSMSWEKGAGVVVYNLFFFFLSLQPPFSPSFFFSSRCWRRSPTLRAAANVQSWRHSVSHCHHSNPQSISSATRLLVYTDSSLFLLLPLVKRGREEQQNIK